jgi:hypothetical protein
MPANLTHTEDRMKADLPLFQANEATAPRRALLRTYVDLFLISFAILFFELACIR